MEESSAFASVLLAAREGQLEARDGALCHELVLGVLRRRLWLDHLITHYSGRDAERLDLAVRIALRLGLYQLRFLSRIPASAAVNESVKLVRVARVRSADTLVNAVLRRATREPEFDPVSDIEEALDRIAVETSHPRWLIERWANAFGRDEAAALAQANNQTPTTSFRVINTRASETEIIQRIRDAGGKVAPSPVSPKAWRAAGSFGVVQRLALEGLIYLQDEASQLVSHLLEAQPGESILDACAAPGSKSTHLADLTNGQTFIVSGDLHLHRLQTLNRLAAAQRLTSIHSVKLDATGALPFREGVFDRVLVDAPCSGTGTLQHNPEIRWRISPRDLVDLPARQLSILGNAAHSVKRGGRLIYSTCSLELDENEEVIERFLAQTSEFKPIRLPANPALQSDAGMVRIWPHKHGADGFFVAGFERQF